MTFKRDPGVLGTTSREITLESCDLFTVPRVL